MKLLNIALPVAGFTAGMIMGFMYSKEVKRVAPSKVTTEYDGGVFVVSTDVSGIVKGAGKNLSGKLLDYID